MSECTKKQEGGCSVGGRLAARGLCSAHYTKALAAGEFSRTVCRSCGELTGKTDGRIKQCDPCKENERVEREAFFNCEDCGEVGNNPKMGPAKRLCYPCYIERKKPVKEARQAEQRQKNRDLRFAKMNMVARAIQAVETAVETESGCLEATVGSCVGKKKDYRRVMVVFDDVSEPVGKSLHRVVAEVFLGSAGVHVHHVCANPICVNPDHLEVTEAHHNVAEMLQRRAYEETIAEANRRLVEAGLEPVEVGFYRDEDE